MPFVAVFHLANQNPLACLAGSACGVNTANGVSASLTGVFCGMCTLLQSFPIYLLGSALHLCCVIKCSHLPLVVLEFALIWTLWRLRHCLIQVA